MMNVKLAQRASGDLPVLPGWASAQAAAGVPAVTVSQSKPDVIV